MTNTSRRARLFLPVLAIFVGLVAGACGSDSSPAAPTGSASARPSVSPAGGVATPASVELAVLADASFTDVLPAIKTAYESANPGVTLAISFGATNDLDGRVQDGAIADVFLAADADTAAALVDAGLTQGPDQPFAGNVLALVVPKDGKKVTKTVDLAKAGVKLVGASKDDPVSIAAAALLDELGKVKGFPAGYAVSVAKNTTSREADVRAVLKKVQSGGTDAGFVYATDAIAAGDAVRAISLPESINPATTCTGVVLRTTANEDAASAFLAWLSSDAGQAILTQAGFQAPAQ
jgi:molybdate transport system substrate-binding protein